MSLTLTYHSKKVPKSISESFQKFQNGKLQTISVKKVWITFFQKLRPFAKSCKCFQIRAQKCSHMGFVVTLKKQVTTLVTTT
jgi:hypothetical protein